MHPDIPSWWDPYSDQPHKLPAGKKPRMTPDNIGEYLKVAATALISSPILLWKYATTRRLPPPPDMKRFVGLSLSPDPRYNDAIVEMVTELGVEELLVRVPVWKLERIGEIQTFIDRFPGCRFLVNVLQCRESVREPKLWRQQLERIFAAFYDQATWFQIGNAVNRSKWGCRHSGEALRLFQIAHDASAGYPNIKLLGSSVIDFEPAVTLRTLLNFSNFHMDGCAAQLYVNRRGSPYAKQYRYFDLERKLRLLHAMLKISNRITKRLWITETNWPLLDTKPYTPNSGHPRSTVDELTQAQYLQEYYWTAWQSGWVEKVYWWQLINPGYGLVDHRGDSLRKMPSFHALKTLLGQGFAAPLENPKRQRLNAR